MVIISIAAATLIVAIPLALFSKPKMVRVRTRREERR